MWEHRKRVLGSLDPFAFELRGALSLSGLSYTQVLSRAHKQFPDVSLDRSALSRWANGHRAPNPKQLLAIQLALKLDLPGMEPMVSSLLGVHRSYDGFQGRDLEDWPLWALCYRSWEPRSLL